MKTLVWDEKAGKMVQKLPEIKIGNERLNRHKTSSLSSNKMVVCETHGTRPQCFVRYKGRIVVCCRHCILEKDNITQAIVRMNFEDDLDSQNPVGHSF